MPADSPARRLVKRVLAPVLDERVYRYLQAAAVVRDIRAGRLAEPELDLVPLAVRPGEVAIDVGANFGMWIPALSSAVGDSGRVYAFEPIPFTVSTLRVVGRLLRAGNLEIVPKACGESAGTIAFTVPLQDSGAISAGQSHAAGRRDDRPGAERHVRWPRAKQVECEAVALDDLLPQLGEVSLLKADVEGAELLALRGARRLLERDAPTVVTEINPWFLEGFGLTVADLTGFLGQRGYRLYRYLTGPSRLEAVRREEVVEDNYVFVHPRRVERLKGLLPTG